MPCYHPLTGYRSREVGPNGKRPIVFNKAKGFGDRPVPIPCGQCAGCRLERSRQWAIRCVHEAQLHEDNSFITLTYNDESLSESRSLVPRDFQLFMKRLRKMHEPKRIRFYHCGEYGERFGRPHYHACLFGHDFEDKKLWKKSNDQDLFRSEELETLWPYGHSSIGTVTFESAAYVARYIMKKISGPAAERHYRYIDPETGEIFDRVPEYTTMSRRPGIGRGWLDRFSSDVYPGDFVVLNNKKLRPPKYYDQQFELMYPGDMEKIKRDRKLSLNKHKENNTPERLRVREQVQLKRLELLPREIG